MFVYDVYQNGELKETVKPINQGILEMYWFMVDKMKELEQKYGNNITAKRRFETR